MVIWANETMVDNESINFENVFIFFFFSVPEVNDDFEDLMNYMRERRAGRPQYGLLG